MFSTFLLLPRVPLRNMHYFQSAILMSSLLLSLVIGPTTSLQAQDPNIMRTNPLLQKSTLQYQAPPFNLIKDEHFKPAFEYALKLNEAEIEKIANNKSKATFQNTVLALELCGQDLTRVRSIFFKLTSANTNPTLQAIEEEFAPKLSAHNDKIYLNSKIYKRMGTTTFIIC